MEQIDVEKATALSQRQSEIAKKPRARKPDPGSGEKFVKAVKAASRKQKNYLNGWNWLEADKQFSGFEVIQVNDEVVRYSFGKKEYRLKLATFARYWSTKNTGR